MTSATLPPVEATAKTAAADEAGTRASSQLKKSAQEFESILLQSWLEKMNQSFVGASASQDPAHDTVSSLGTQAIASALAARGGIGIAAMLLRQLHPADSSQPTQHRGLGVSSERAFRDPKAESFAASGTGLPKVPSR